MMEHVLVEDKPQPALQRVASSNISHIAYNEADKELHVRFKDRVEFAYAGVDAALFKRFVSSESIGSFFHHNIRDKFLSRKVER